MRLLFSKISKWLNHHINEGKQELNFSEFAGYDVERKLHKLKKIAESVEQHDMPLRSYLWIYANARLMAVQRQAIVNWAKLVAMKVNK